MYQRTQHRRWIVSFVIAIIALTVATPVLAEYLGPNRTITETTTVCKVHLYSCEYVAAKDDYRYKVSETWSCSLESKPWRDYPNSGPACNSLNIGADYWGREDEEQTQTNTYPPATISGALQSCTLRNGWCVTQPQLALNALEPVAGHSIVVIEGIRNDVEFACWSDTCNPSLIQGDNNFTFWALSTFGDSTTMGTLTAKVDSQLPSISGTFSGVPGSNGWYLGPATFSGSATDATSGLASFTCTLDGVALGSCSTVTVGSAGPHSLVLTARDNAGHIQTLTRNASIDLHNPSLDASISGTLGSNTWYTSATLNASASDPAPGSGLARIQYNLDGSGWVTFPASGTLNLPDGKHTLDLRAVDKAGRTTSAAKPYWLDAAAPNVNLDAAGTSGLNGWYISSPALTASANDDTSGLEQLEYNLDNSGWTAYTSPLNLSDGIHSVSIWAQDQAGLVTQVDRTYQVDTRAPQIAGSLSGTPGMNGWYISEVAVSASASDPQPGSDIDAFFYTLNGGAETPFTDPLILSDGQHTIQFLARDKAGQIHSVEQALLVDTLPPSMTVDTILPSWVKGPVTFTGTASDLGSGLSSVDISLDGGQTWQPAADTDSWNHILNTAEGPNGAREIRMRAVDQAGLTIEQTVNVGVDNQLPEISLPASWLQWDAVTLNISDTHSGLSEARIEISDPQGRWPTRVLQLDPTQFPLQFKWDRRFGDDTIAEAGTYDVKVFASDHLGNTAEKTASIRVLLEILPPGPTSTPVVSFTATPPIATKTSSPSTPVNAATSTPRAVPTAIIRVFGTIEPPVLASPTLPTISIPRATPTQSNAVDWLESVFVPNANAVTTTETISTKDEPQPASTNNSVLWGTAATAAIAAATAYVQEEKRKREEEKARQEALAAREEERREKMKEKKTAKNEAKRAQEAAWEQARLEQAKDSYPMHTEVKIARQEHEQAVQDSLKFSPPVEKSTRPTSEDKRAERKEALIEQETNSYSAKPQDWKASYDTYMAQKAQEEEAAKKVQEAATTQSKKETWWDKTKSFVSENIIQPVNTHVIQPFVTPAIEKIEEKTKEVVSRLDKTIYERYIEPAIERSKQFATSELAWINENLVEPYVKPAVEKISEATTSGISWLKEKVYEPHIQPAIEKTIKDVSSGVRWFNEKVYQPYIEPVVKVVNEKVYEPYLEPVIKKVSEASTQATDWINENIYEPYLEPVVSDINQYIYQPLVNKATNWWDEYGEWVHGALDAAGFIPGLGEIADGLNGLIYLGEGRYVDASLSLMSMIPLIGDLGKAAKWTVKAGQEVVETAVEKVVKEAAEEVIEKATKEILEEGAEKVIKETTEELLEKAIKETFVEATENTVLKSSEEIIEQVTKVVEEASTVVDNRVVEKTVEEVLEKVSDETVQRLVKDVVAGQVSRLPAEVAKNLTQESASELAEKISKELGDKKVWVSAKTGSMYISSPPAEGFQLANQLMETDLTKAEEVEKILKRVAELTSRGSGNHVVLGPFRPNGTFIQEALDTNGVFWDVGDELWEALADTGVDMFKANDQFLRVQIERGTHSFDFVATDVNQVINDFNNGPTIDWGDLKYTEKEILDLATTPNAPYKLVGNSWIRTDVVSSLN